MKASLNEYRQSPRKVRLVTEAVKGKRVTEALHILHAMIKRGAGPVHKLVSSAAANAENMGIARDTLVIKKIVVDEGPVMKRIMPRARGSAAQILKRTSKVFVQLESVPVAPKTKARKSKVVKK